MGQYVKLDEPSPYWCESHRRVATHISIKGDIATPCCAPWMGGIMLPCKCVVRVDDKTQAIRDKLTMDISEIRKTLTQVLRSLPPA